MIDKNALLAHIKTLRADPYLSEVERASYDHMAKIIREFPAETASDDLAETFPARIEKCEVCGRPHPHIVNISYRSDIAFAYYLCKTCKVVHEKRRFRRLGND